MRKFAIDGTGQVIRPGDTVLFKPDPLARTFCEGVIDEITSEVELRIVGHGRAIIGNLFRADAARDFYGHPLWVS